MLLDAPRVPYAEVEIQLAPGRAGVVQTLHVMRELVRQYKRDAHIRATAAMAVQSIPLKSWRVEAKALFEFVRQHIRYTLDTVGHELIQTPDRLLDTRAGDCDDMAVLLASLLESIGHPTRFVAIGMQPGELTHVFVETKIGDVWVAADPTEQCAFGWSPEFFADRHIVHN